MGSKSSNAPAPDPRLVEAQIKSMGIQDGAIQRILQQSDEMQPLQKEQLQFGLETARTAYDQSQQDRDWMLGRRGSLSTMQDTLVQDAKSFNTESRADELAGKAMADVSQGFANAQGQQTRQLARMGVNPNDGKFAAIANQMTMSKALGQAQAATGARDRARTEGFALTDRAANALSGFPAMSMQATGAGAGFGASGTNLANQGLAGMNSGLTAAGTMAGQMGQNATSMYGAQASYKNQQDQIAASSNPMSTILGAAAGVGTSWALGKIPGSR